MDKWMLESLNKKLLDKGIPSACADGLARYVVNHCPVGKFLRAVLENDLVGAFGRADAFNSLNMRIYAEVLYNDLPTSCWGSEKKVKAWLNKRGQGDSDE